MSGRRAWRQREGVFRLDNEQLNWVTRRLTPRPVAAPIVEQLWKSKPVWLRACVYLSLPNRVPPVWVESLLVELRQEVAPLSKDILIHRLEELGSKDFKTREAAEKYLSSKADRSAVFLRTALEGDLSLEASERVQRILDRAKRPPDQHQLLCSNLLSRRPTGKAERPLIAIFREGDPHCDAVKSAQSIK